ncbi:MAG: hypothetical protein ACK4WC_09820 [Rubrimonas sp.]
MLVRIADALPRVLRRSAMLVAAARLRRYALTALPLEDAALLGPLLDAADADDPAARVAAILRRKGAEAAGRAIELADALEAVASRPAAPEAEALGFMLRECFDAIERRAELIEAAILPAARASRNRPPRRSPAPPRSAVPCPGCACAGHGAGGDAADDRAPR